MKNNLVYMLLAFLLFTISCKTMVVKEQKKEKYLESDNIEIWL